MLHCNHLLKLPEHKIQLLAFSMEFLRSLTSIFLFKVQFLFQEELFFDLEIFYEKIMIQ